MEAQKHLSAAIAGAGVVSAQKWGGELEHPSGPLRGLKRSSKPAWSNHAALPATAKSLVDSAARLSVLLGDVDGALAAPTELHSTQDAWS